MSVNERKMPEPYEILELADGQSVELRLVTWERGTMTITPRYEGAAGSKEIPVLRVHVAAGVKPYPPMYYDITSKTLMAQMLPHLSQPNFERFVYRITKHGVAPTARFTLEVRPLA
jgi:hypothetical protein